MLAGALEDAMSGCKTRGTDFSIDAIMSRGSAHSLRGSPSPVDLGELLRKNALKQGKILWIIPHSFLSPTLSIQ